MTIVPVYQLVGIIDCLMSSHLDHGDQSTWQHLVEYVGGYHDCGLMGQTSVTLPSRTERLVIPWYSTGDKSHVFWVLRKEDFIHNFALVQRSTKSMKIKMNKTVFLSCALCGMSAMATA